MSTKNSNTRYMTVVLAFDGNQKNASIEEIEKLTGGKWTAGAVFNVVHALEIAQEALEQLRGVDVDDPAANALDKIEAMELRQIS